MDNWKIFLDCLEIKYFDINLFGFSKSDLGYYVYPVICNPYIILPKLKYLKELAEQFSHNENVDVYRYSEANTFDIIRTEYGEDYNYQFCICEDCGFVGIEFEGRSDRLPCKRKKFKPCKITEHGDKGRNPTHLKLLQAYKKAGISCLL